MFGNDCLECAIKNTLLEEKDNKIQILQNNLFEMKNKIQESNNLINVYFMYKNENESLRNELENLKKRSGDLAHVSQLEYDLSVLNTKFNKEREKNSSLLLLNNQLTAKLEKGNNDRDNKSGTYILTLEISKIRKELSEREKFINQQNLIIEKMRNQLIRKDDDISMKEPVPEPLTIQGDFTVKQLYEENEFLKKKYHKYHTKYYKFKSKYEECKRLIDLFTISGFNNRVGSQNNPVRPYIESQSQLIEYNDLKYENYPVRQINLQEDFNKLEKKRSNLSQIFEEGNKNDIFTKIDLDILDMPEEEKDANEVEKVKKSKKKQKKEAKKMKSKVKKEKSRKGSEDLEEVNKKNKGKLITALKKIKQVNVKQADIVLEVPKVIDTRDPLSHIYPLPRPKVKIDADEIINKNKKKAADFITFINTIDFSKEQIISFIKADNKTSTYEMIVSYLSYIESNLNNIDLFKVLFFINTMLEHLNDVNIFEYFKEYILSNLSTLLSKSEILIFDPANSHYLDELFPYKDNDITVEDIGAHQYFFLSLTLGIFYKDLRTISQVYEFIIDLLHTYNKEIVSVLNLFRRLIYKYNHIELPGIPLGEAN
jgi:hypothetical protein